MGSGMPVPERIEHSANELTEHDVHRRRIG
jgi:hypothetical protein